MLIVRGKHTGTWVAIGAALGTALGTALGNTPLGLAAGAGVGLAVALFARQSGKRVGQAWRGESPDRAGRTPR